MRYLDIVKLRWHRSKSIVRLKSSGNAGGQLSAAHKKFCRRRSHDSLFAAGGVRRGIRSWEGEASHVKKVLPARPVGTGAIRAGQNVAE
jgi:hypothetical protein